MLSGFADAHERHWAEGMAAKLGLAAPDRELVEDILKLMRLQKVDFTQFFRALSAGTARTLFTEPEPFDAWSARREVLLRGRSYLAVVERATGRELCSLARVDVSEVPEN